MIGPHPFTQEVMNRLEACPPEQRRDRTAALLRITVEVTREWMEYFPEGLDDFLAMHRAQKWTTH